MASNVPKRRRALPFVLVGAAVLVLIGISVGVACGGGGDGSWEVDQQTLKSLEKGVSQIEGAFRAGDVNAVISLTHPAVRSSYQPIFEAHGADLKRVADLLATRKLISVTDSMAEYEVTENGETFYVTFESWGEQWYLSSL